MPKAITTTRYRLEVEVECRECGPKGFRTREWVRQHADRKRHTVRFVIEDITTYRPTEETHA